MSYTHVEKWYCCLNDAERGAFNMLATNAGPITYFFVKVEWDVYWAVFGNPMASLRSDLIIRNWGITIGTLPPGDPEGIEVMYLDPTIWDEIKAFVVSPAGACPNPCKILTFIP